MFCRNEASQLYFGRRALGSGSSYGDGQLWIEVRVSWFRLEVCVCAAALFQMPVIRFLRNAP